MNNLNFLVVGVAWWHPEEIPFLNRSRSIMPLPTIVTNPKRLGFRGGMAPPWRNTFVKSKQKHNATPHNDNSKKLFVGLTWWYPEEIPWLSRSRIIIMPLPTIMTIQKNYFHLGVAWWHPEELRWLSRSGRIMPHSHNNDTSKKIGCRGGMVAPWSNTLAKSKQKHNDLPTIMIIPKKLVV